MKPFYVLFWDFNKIQPEAYDIMPYLVSEYRNMRPSNEYYPNLNDYESCKKFVDSRLKYRYWARCEYEFVMTQWPSGKYPYKIDIYDQCKMNLDLITELFIHNITYGN